MGFSLQWLLLLKNTGSRCTGFSSCSSWALKFRLSNCFPLFSLSTTTKISIVLMNWCTHFLPEVKEVIGAVAQSCPTLCNPMACSTSGLPVHHQLLELTQTHVHQVNDAIQPSHPLSPPSPPTFNLSQHQGLFKWVSSSHQVAKVLELQLQPQSF